MRTKSDFRIPKFVLGLVLGGMVLLLCFGMGSLPIAHAQEAATPEPNPYYTVNTFTQADGTQVDQIIINGPPSPPPGFEVERQAVSLPKPDIAAGVNILTVPAYDWVFGCSAVSASMIAGYHDRNGFPNMYTGPTDGGVMPLNNSVWPTWSDGFKTYPSIPLAGSRNGVDGRTTRGSLDDYWVQVDSAATDPYIAGGWAEHTYGDALGDYMKTSQSAYSNVDGSTQFWGYTSLASPYTCDTAASGGRPDGSLGRRLFYQARGYTVTDCYNQKTDNTVAGGFSFAQFKAEIDAGHPVLLNLKGHSIVGVGYDDASNTIYIHDTWDYDNHTMPWGGSYAGMLLQSVSIVNVAGGSAPLTPPVVTASDGTDSTGVVLSWTASAGATNYLVFRADSLTGAKIPPSGYPVSGLGGTDVLALPGVTYYYWVKACDATSCSDFSVPDTGFRGAASALTPPVVTASDGTSTSAVNLSWTASSGATYYLAYRSDSLTGSKIPPTGYPVTGLGGADALAVPGVTYYYWVKACNSTSCSDFSAPDTGWRGGSTGLTPPVVTASDGTFPGMVWVNWTASSGASYYLVYRSDGLTGVKIPPAGYSTTDIFAIDLWSSPGVMYNYWVKACNATACSDFSAPETGWGY